jgi:SAM-dependent methyltransferase/uncharacterized protein YbaR (Trm112 family)
LIEWEQVSHTLSDADRARAESLGIEPAEIASDTITGALVNHARKLVYPIVRGVPRMLTFKTRVAEEFWQERGDELRRKLPGYELPAAEPRPGEQDVLRTFSSEWVNFDWDGETYWGLDPELWFKSMRFILGLDRDPVVGKKVLEVGIGVGGVADYMARKEGCEVIGMDLGYGVEVAFKHFGRNPFLHIVQGSAFAPPFPTSSFDFVYSFGVLHHTYSTETAVDSVSSLPKAGGRLYVWVYSPYDEQRTLIRRTLMAMENVIRPIVWRLPEGVQGVVLSPLVPLYIAHQWLRKQRGRAVVNYGFHEAMHAARDRFTPRYVGRHTDEEVAAWFHKAGYGDLTFNSQMPRPDYVPLAMTACTGVNGRRQS